MSDAFYPFVLTPETSGAVLWFSEWHSGVRIVPFFILLCAIAALAIFLPLIMPTTQRGVNLSLAGAVVAGYISAFVLMCAVVLIDNPLFGAIVGLLGLLLAIGIALVLRKTLHAVA